MLNVLRIRVEQRKNDEITFMYTKECGLNEAAMGNSRQEAMCRIGMVSEGDNARK